CLPPGGPARGADARGGVTMRERLRGVSKLEPLDGVFAAWRRLPHGSRAAVPVIVVIALAATYPCYVSSLPTDVPVILAFPDVGACVTIIIFVMMAVGRSIVAGFGGALALAHVH